MVAEAYAAFGAFKTALDMAKALKGINDATIRNGAVIELQEQILAAQEAQTSAVQRIRELEARVASFETWEAEKERYQLSKLRGGLDVFAYSIKPEMQGTEPPHSICPDCYQQRTKSILQSVERYPGGCKVLLCQRCGWEAYVAGAWMAEHGATKSASRRR